MTLSVWAASTASTAGDCMSLRVQAIPRANARQFYIWPTHQIGTNASAGRVHLLIPSIFPCLTQWGSAHEQGKRIRSDSPGALGPYPRRKNVPPRGFGVRLRVLSG